MRAALLLLSLCIPMLPDRALAAVLIYPGCAALLQTCIDNSASGDTVEIATNTPIAESPMLSHSLTLRSAAGFTGTLAPTHYVFAITSGAASFAYAIEGITLQGGTITVNHGGSGALGLQILDNVVTGTDLGAVEVFAGGGGPWGPVSLTISGNQISLPPPFFSGANAIAVALIGADVTGIIERNAIVMAPNEQGGAIRADNAANIMVLDVFSNAISGTDYDLGIGLIQEVAGGVLNTRVIGNVVTGQNGNTGLSTAIGVSASGGLINSFVINNTLSQNRFNLYLAARTDLGATHNAFVANNVIANSELGVGVDGADVTNAGSNLLLCNARKFGFPNGPDTLKRDPEFTSSVDHAPLPWSPAIDAGDSASLPGDVTLDQAGNPRIVGAAVDIGALELQSPSQPRSSLQNDCAAAKLRAAGGLVADKLKCHATAVKVGQSADPGCLGTADTRFGDAFADAEALGGCLTTMDEGAVAGMLNGVVTQAVGDLTPGMASGLCASKKIAAAGKKFRKRTVCRAAGLSAGASVSVSCLAGASKRLCSVFDRAERQPGCPTARDKGALGIDLNRAADDLLTALQIPQ